MISLVVATGNSGEIGKDNQLLWHLPADLSYFKQLTTGKTIVMGRKTFESIGRPLPNRRNIVVSRNPDFTAAGCEVFQNLQAALDACSSDPEVMVIGGASIYEIALPMAKRVYRTIVHGDFEADRFFNQFKTEEFVQHLSLHRPADEKNQYACTFEMWERH